MNLLPYSEEAEKGLISSFFQSPKIVGNLCAEKKLSSKHFHLPSHGAIFGMLMKLWSENEEIDFMVVTSKLRDSGQLEDAGGAAYVTELGCLCPSAAMAGPYLEILEEKRISREIIRICTEFADRARDEPEEPLALSLELQTALGAISAQTNGQSKPFKTLLMETMDSIERGDDTRPDILSGLEELDRVVKMQRGNFVVISGEAKGGKTALAGTIATNAAVYQAKRVAIVSLEMSDVEMVKRMISCAGRVNIAMMGRTPAQYDIDAAIRGATALNTASVEVETGSFDLGSIAARLRQMHAKQPLDLVVLDYIQLVEATTGRKGETRQEIVAQISRTCKRLAGELNCVFIGLSQLNEDGKLRESRAIGQDANAVIAVEKTEDGGRILRVVAQRNGPSNEEVSVQWLPQFTKFENKL